MKYKRIYEKDGVTLKGYECDKVFIKVEYYDVTSYGNWHKDYVVDELKEKGYASRFETLKEAKEYIERYL